MVGCNPQTCKVGNQPTFMKTLHKCGQYCLFKSIIMKFTMYYKTKLSNLFIKRGVDNIG